MTQKLYKFGCGCAWPILQESSDPNVLPLLDFDVEKAPEDCPATWAMLGEGKSKGVFQLETQLGRQWCKKLKPEHSEHMSALGAILRPGCIGGDTNVCIALGTREGRNIHCRKMPIRELYEKFARGHFHYTKQIVSLNEDSLLLFNNEIQDVTFSGTKDVYRPIFKVGVRRICTAEEGFYQLECTDDHKLLTHDRGWIELREIQYGERVGVLRLTKASRAKKYCPGEKSFRDICHFHYQRKCVLCDWNEGSLDVNHIEENRKRNNDPENLCFLCPNHHRMFTEGTISPAAVRQEREKYRLSNSEHIQWVEYLGKEQLGKKDTYDISVVGPHHSFVAGNVIVHNCLKAYDEEGVSATQHYCRRKNKEEDTVGYHPAVDPILFPTYNIMVYQEQAMAIAQAVAGFNLQDADVLRKAIGKKLPEEMAKVKKMFVEGAEKTGTVSTHQAEELFGWIEKSQRYSFNHSHALCYGLTGYDTAYIKAHFPVAFFTAWLYYAKDKADPLQEIFELVNDAKLFNIDVEPPDLRSLEAHFHTDRKVIRFGLSDIKGVGEAQVVKLVKAVNDARELLGNRPPQEWSWLEFLLLCSTRISPSILMKLIEVGALRWFKMERQRMLAEHRAWTELTEPEQQWVIEAFRVARGDFVREELEALKEQLKSAGKEDGVARLKLKTVDLRLKLMDQGLPQFVGIVYALLSVGRAKKEGGGCSNVNRVAIIQSLVSLLERPPTPHIDSPVWIAWVEEEHLGIPITCSKIDACDVSQVNVSCKDYLAGQSGFLIFGVEVQQAREVKTKRGKTPGQKMAFLSLTDSSCSLEDVVCFPETWKEYGHLLVEGNTVLLQGERTDKKDSNTLVVKKVWQANQTSSAAA